MVLVYFRGHGNWYLTDESGLLKPENKVEHRELSADNPRQLASDFYRPADAVEGVFRLTDSDDLLHQITGMIDKEKISQLLPCQHPHSAFQKLVDKDRLPAKIFDRCYFEIRRNRSSESFLTRHPERRERGKLEYLLEIIKSTETNDFDVANLQGPLDPGFLDFSHKLHSLELKIAYEAWNAVLKGNPEKPKRGSRKKLIENWLWLHYPKESELSQEARKRIVTLVNSDTDKRGGGPPTL